jgi:hypothetical protein
MQIHELTQKPLKEGALTSIAKGVASQVASNASQKILGTDVFDKTDQSMGPESEQRARAMSRSLITQQAATNQKLWNQGVASMMQKAGVGSAAQLDSTSQQSLAINLLNQLHKNFLQGKIEDYKQLPNVVNVPQPPSQTPPATEVVRNIETAMDQINSLRNIDNPQASTADWQKLATAAYDGLALLQFHPKTIGTSKASAVTDPQVDAAMKAIGLDPAALTTLNAVVKKSGGVKPTGNATLDGILKAANLI